MVFDWPSRVAGPANGRSFRKTVSRSHSYKSHFVVSAVRGLAPLASAVIAGGFKINLEFPKKNDIEIPKYLSKNNLGISNFID